MSMLYIDCSMGAAGDMLTAALYELLGESEKKEFLKTIKEAGIPDVTLDIERTKKCGISGSHFKVLVAGLEEGEEH
ncbi:MAG: LarC family nickel insertion protein, partial [Lachnospiraceae bacterium]|nr:LarC family nickel insertion protein [Lachnospiraceae bacterium]